MGREGERERRGDYVQAAAYRRGTALEQRKSLRYEMRVRACTMLRDPLFNVLGKQISIVYVR